MIRKELETAVGKEVLCVTWTTHNSSGWANWSEFHRGTLVAVGDDGLHDVRIGVNSWEANEDGIKRFSSREIREVLEPLTPEQEKEERKYHAMVAKQVAKQASS
jgi:hypothetical protein